MDCHELLTTTRSVRKRLDLERSVPPEILRECLEVAIQAPSASNLQNWRFLVLTEEAPKKIVASSYRKAFKIYSKRPPAELPPDDPRVGQRSRGFESAMYLAQIMHRVPVLVLPCLQGPSDDFSTAALSARYGSILPAAWSFMLALRSRGLGSVLTTMHLAYEEEVAAGLGLPADVRQICLLPVAYTKGTDFKPARRLPVEQVTCWNSWGDPPPWVSV